MIFNVFEFYFITSFKRAFSQYFRMILLFKNKFDNVFFLNPDLFRFWLHSTIYFYCISLDFTVPGAHEKSGVTFSPILCHTEKNLRFIILSSLTSFVTLYSISYRFKFISRLIFFWKFYHFVQLCYIFNFFYTKFLAKLC